VELFLRRFWAYALWALVQEYVLLGFFFLRLLRLLENKKKAILLTAGLFTLAHLPNPVLMPLVFVWGLIASAVFLRWRNLYTLGMAHAILGICIAVTVPGRIDHNMRVGLGYLQYRYDPAHQRLYSQRPQTVSTVACVIAEAPTRRP
jgi:membrane protease YdiL (CAAX protease family)